MGRYRPKTDADEHIFRFAEGNIRTLARTIIFATQYIDSRAGDASDEDVAALEEISAEFKKSSVEEKTALSKPQKSSGLNLGWMKWALIKCAEKSIGRLLSTSSGRYRLRDNV